MPEKGYLVSEEFARRTTKAVKRVEDMARNAERIARSASDSTKNIRFCKLKTPGFSVATDPLTGATTCDATMLTPDYSVAHVAGDPFPLAEVPDPEGEITLVNRSVDLTAGEGTLVIAMWNGLEWMPIWVDCSSYSS